MIVIYEVSYDGVTWCQVPGPTGGVFYPHERVRHIPDPAPDAEADTAKEYIGHPYKPGYATDAMHRCEEMHGPHRCIQAFRHRHDHFFISDEYVGTGHGYVSNDPEFHRFMQSPLVHHEKADAATPLSLDEETEITPEQYRWLVQQAAARLGKLPQRDPAPPATCTCPDDEPGHTSLTCPMFVRPR